MGHQRAIRCKQGPPKRRAHASRRGSSYWAADPSPGHLGLVGDPLILPMFRAAWRGVAHLCQQCPPRMQAWARGKLC